MNRGPCLAKTWYSSRLQENSRRPQLEEMRQIFAALDLRETSGTLGAMPSGSWRAGEG